MKKIIKVGIAGYGRSGCDIHARWLREDTERFKIVAVADQLADRRAEAKRDLNCAVFNDYKALLKNTEMDLFVNAMPSLLHSPGTVAGFRAGNHVVSEKPAGRTVKLFDNMVEAAKEAKKVFAPFQNSRFYPYFKKMREIIDSGVLGEIVHIRAVWSGFGRRWDWQTLQEMHGGNLLNTGPHPMDQAIVLFGNRMPKVFCQMKSIQPFGGDADDFCTVTLYGKNAPVIEILVSSYLAYPVGNQYTVCGSLGGLTGGPSELKWKYFDPEKAPKQKLWKPWSDHRRYCSEELPWVEESWTAPKPKHEGFQGLSAGFYANLYDVLVNKGKLVATPKEVRRQIAAIEECHRQNPLPKRKKSR